MIEHPRARMACALAPEAPESHLPLRLSHLPTGPTVPSEHAIVVNVITACPKSQSCKELATTPRDFVSGVFHRLHAYTLPTDPCTRKLAGTTSHRSESLAVCGAVHAALERKPGHVPSTIAAKSVFWVLGAGEGVLVGGAAAALPLGG